MKMASVVLKFHILFSLRLLLLCGRFVGMVCQSLVNGLLLRSFLAFLCTGRCLAYPIANIFEPLQIRLDFFKGNTQLCDFAHKGFTLFFEFLCCGGLGFGVLAQNSSGFLKLGNFGMLLSEFLLEFLEVDFLILFVKGLHSLKVSRLKTMLSIVFTRLSFFFI